MLSLESVFVLTICIASTVAAPNPLEDGTWDPYKYGNTGKFPINKGFNPYEYGNTGKYIPTDEGKYIHIPNPYIHIDNPYIHDYEPYVQAASQYRYTQIPPEEPNPFYRPGYYKNNGIKILSQNHNYEEDKYDFEFKTENKIRAEESAVIKNPNTVDEGIASKGFYEYIGPDGFMYRVEYTADENGFRPKMKRIATPYSGKWVLERVN